MATYAHPSTSSASSVASVSSTTNDNDAVKGRPGRLVPYSLIPLNKEDIKKHALKYIDTEFANVLAPAYPNDEGDASGVWKMKKMDAIIAKMTELRNSSIKRAMMSYTKKVLERSKHYKPTKGGSNCVVPDSLIDFFHFFATKFPIWRKFLDITVPIFLIPLQNCDDWLSEACYGIEHNNGLDICRIVPYDDKTVNTFVHLVGRKAVTDAVNKLFRRHLEKSLVDIYYKKPKKGKLSALREKDEADGLQWGNIECITFTPQALDYHVIKRFSMWVVFKFPKNNMEEAKKLMNGQLVAIISMAKDIGLNENEFKDAVYNVWRSLPNDNVVRNFTFFVFHDVVAISSHIVYFTLVFCYCTGGGFD